MQDRVVSRGRLGWEWPHAILSNRARQIDRVALQGGEGVQDALYMSEGACPADLAIRTPIGKWPLKYVNMLRVIWGYTYNSSSSTLLTRAHLTVVSRLLRPHRCRPWLESAGERRVTMDHRSSSLRQYARPL